MTNKRTQIIQNKALRLIGEFQNCQNTAECFRKNDILNIGELRDYKLAIIVFQSVNKVSPEYFYDFLKTNSFYHPYFTQNSGLFIYLFSI